METMFLDFITNPYTLGVVGSLVALAVAMMLALLFKWFVTTTVDGFIGRQMYRDSDISSEGRKIRHDTSTGPVIGRIGKQDKRGVPVIYENAGGDEWQDFVLWHDMPAFIQKVQTLVKER